MKPNNVLLSILGAFCTGVLMTYAAASAQTNPEEQARAILQLFEAGQKDSAYALLEPLKKSARFVPAVMYARAEMTPDDRALGLYKELIAMEPASPWAEKASYQLVVRYTEKRDSLAAYLWDGVLKKNFAGSQFVGTADELLAGVKSWHSIDDVAELGPKGKSGSGTAHGVSKSAPAPGARAAAASKPSSSADGKPAAKASTTAAKTTGKATPPAAAKPATKPAGTAAARPGAKSAAAPAARQGTKPGAAAATPSGSKPAASPVVADTAKADGSTPAAATAPATATPAAATTATAKPAAAAKSDKWFALQVAAFPTKPQAIARAAELKKKKVNATPLPKLNTSGKKSYALVVGHYSTLEDANNGRGALKSKCDCQPFAVEIR
ncbi:MAG TPA: SPOR domain-containing protein [Candidatus Kapabacteria bacterium]|nr:SPOR domain-containing protein [Candidatus Kapabacteria bacterium]